MNRIRKQLAVSGACLLLAPCLFAAENKQAKQPVAKKPAAAGKAVPVKAASPAAAGAVIVKDWESGPNATRAARAGDLTAPAGNAAARISNAAVTRSDGSLEYSGPELMTTMTVSKAPDGTVSFDCKQGGDHAGHKHPAPVKATAGEAK